MLDAFEIMTTSGVVLWSKCDASVGSHIVNDLINDIFIEEKAGPQSSSVEIGAPVYKKEKYSLKWRRVKDFGLIFVAVYQSLLHLSWVDKLLDDIAAIFVDLYKDQLRSSRCRIVEYPFDKYFDKKIQELEDAASVIHNEGYDAIANGKKDFFVSSDNGGPPPPSVPSVPKAQHQAAHITVISDESTPSQSPNISRSSTPVLNPILTGKGGPGGRVSRRARKAAHTNANLSSGEEGVRKAKASKAGGKRMRKWDADGLMDEDNGEILDYSAVADSEDASAPTIEPVSQDSWGVKTAKGQFILKDLGDETHSISEKAKANASAGVVESSFNAISGLLRNIVGGKVLTDTDLENPLKSMEEHLLKKNVAREAAVRLCEGVRQELTGQKTGNFQSVDSVLRAAMESSLQKILTPTSSLDLLHEIQAVTSPATKQQAPRPYVISIVGVNGVGKSTNLSKICFFLLQNNYRVLIAACDTFRSGAVEQLRVHARNLRELSARENVGDVELYEKGYGKDAANVARDAVNYAATNKFDVVLIDTAGRRHNDQRLMSSLEKFAKFANPDKIFMVGEALVGTDSVMQARNFNQAFGPGRNLDGFIISKCDTVGDMVGTLVSMVHATGIPIVFLGVGQHYGDLRGLSVPWAVGLLMK
jgi:signal recognition particle receptor subunit alpha